MKSKITLIILIIGFFIFTNNKNFGQVIEQGEISYGVLNWEVDHETKDDSLSVKNLIELITPQFTKTIIFNENTFVALQYDTEGQNDLLRTLYNAKTHTIYVFNESLKAYLIDTLNNLSQFDDETPFKHIKIISEEAEPTEMFGLATKKIILKSDYDPNIIEMIVAPNVKLPKNQFSQKLNFGMSGLILKTKFKIPGGYIIVGVTDFSTHINNPDYLSQSLINYSDASKNKETLEDIFSEKELEKEIKGQGKNLELVDKLLKDGLIDSTSYFSKYEIPDLKKYNSSIDLTSLLKELKKNGTKKINSSKNSILEYIKRYNLLTEPNISKMMLFNSNNPALSIDDFWNAIIILSLNEHLSSVRSKKIIINNLKQLYTVDSLDSNLGKEYINGKLDFSEYLTKSCELLFPVKYGFTDNFDETKKIIEYFVKIAIGDLVDSIKFRTINDTFIVSTPKYDYSISYNELKEIDYNNVSDTDNYFYKDTIILNLDFYNKLLKTIKQIDADYNLPYAFAMYDFDVAFKLGIEDYDYKYILKKLPDIKRNNLEFVLNRFLTEEYDIFLDVPISYKFHSAKIDKQIRLRSLKIGDVDGNTEYVTSLIKQKFIKYLHDNSLIYKVNANRIKEIEKEIQNKLISGNYSLLDYIPNFGYTYSFFSDPFLMDTKYVPYIDSSRNDFKNVFPDLNNLVNGEFDATEFKFDADNHKISFEYQNISYSISASKMNMLQTIAKILKANNNEAKIYKLYIGFGDTKYYYLTNNQKSDIEKLINYNLDIVD